MIKLDYARAELFLDGKYLYLPPMELNILNALIQEDGRVMTRAQIYKKARPGEESLDVYNRTVDQHIARLRRRLGKFRGHIKTVATRGYKYSARG